MTRMEHFRRSARGEIARAMAEAEMDKAEVARRSGIAYSTLCKRIRDPTTMSLGELQRIADAMRMKTTITLGVKGGGHDENTITVGGLTGSSTSRTTNYSS